MRQAWLSFSKHSLYDKLLSLNPLSWDMDCLLTLWLLSLVPLVTVAVHLVFWSLSLSKETSCTTAYIYSQKIIKAPLLHQSLGPWVFLSLSHSPRLIPWSTETRLAHSPARASKTLSRRHTVPSPPPWEGAWCLHERCKSCVKDFIRFLRKPQNISLFLFFTFLWLPLDRQVPVN